MYLPAAVIGMMPSGGSHDTITRGNPIEMLSPGLAGASMSDYFECVRFSCSPAGSNAISFPHPSRAVRSSLRSMSPRIECSMRLSSYRAMIESLSRGDNDPPSRESGQEDTLSSPETPCEENVGLFSRRFIHQSFFSVRSDDLWVNGCLKQATRPWDSNLFC